RLGSHRIDGASGDELAFELGGDGAGEERNAVRVVRGPVERVDDAAQLAPAARATLFRQDRRAGSAIAQEAQDLLLGGSVGVRDQIDASLERDLARLVEQLAQHLRPGLGRRDADPLQLRVLHRPASASRSFWWNPPNPPFDMPRMTSPGRASLASSATIASG